MITPLRSFPVVLGWDCCTLQELLNTILAGGAGAQQGGAGQGGAAVVRPPGLPLGAPPASSFPAPRPLDKTELTITDAVLCSEMGVHFSPCGRYLAACIACKVHLSCYPGVSPEVISVAVCAVEMRSVTAPGNSNARWSFWLLVWRSTLSHRMINIAQWLAGAAMHPTSSEHRASLTGYLQYLHPAISPSCCPSLTCS